MTSSAQQSLVLLISHCNDNDDDNDNDNDNDNDGDGDGDGDNELLYMLLKEFMCFHVALIIYCLFFSFHANSSSPVQVSVICACVSVMCRVCVSASVICHVRLCHCHVCVSVSVMFVSVSVITLGLSVHQTVSKLCSFNSVM